MPYILWVIPLETNFSLRGLVFLQWQDGEMDFHKEKSECIFLHNTHACRQIYHVSSVHFRSDGRQEWLTCDKNVCLCIDEIKISRELS